MKTFRVAETPSPPRLVTGQCPRVSPQLPDRILPCALPVTSRILCLASVLGLRPFSLIAFPMTFASWGTFTAQSWHSELITVNYKVALKWLALSW